MIQTVKFPARVLLQRMRAGLRASGLAVDKCYRLGPFRLAKLAIARKCVQGRPVSIPPATVRPGPGSVFDVIYAVGYWDGEPKRYRVFNMVEGLRAAGYSVHVMPFQRAYDLPRHRWRARTLVLFRAEYDPLVGIAEVLAYARATGMRVVYDIDDLVFDPSLAHRIDGLRLMGFFQRRQFVAAMSRRRRLLLACDLASVSTAPLGRAVSALGRPAFVLPNSLGDVQLRLAEEIAHRPREANGKLTIGYFSGSHTHQRDFVECEQALLQIMERFGHVYFRAVGYLDLGPKWSRYAERVERIGFLTPDDLLRMISSTDINLAPLERGNPFCEAKSELKFFEAALVGVPTVASDTETFAAAIQNGTSGFLARDDAEWTSALESLVADAARRKQMGEAAKVQALLRYSRSAVLPRAVAALGLA